MGKGDDNGLNAMEKYSSVVESKREVREAYQKLDCLLDAIGELLLVDRKKELINAVNDCITELLVLYGSTFFDYGMVEGERKLMGEWPKKFSPTDLN